VDPPSVCVACSAVSPGEGALITTLIPSQRIRWTAVDAGPGGPWSPSTTSVLQNPLPIGGCAPCSQPRPAPTRPSTWPGERRHSASGISQGHARPPPALNSQQPAASGQRAADSGSRGSEQSSAPSSAHQSSSMSNKQRTNLNLNLPQTST
jgi:hypothetical protein